MNVTKFRKLTIKVPVWNSDVIIMIGGTERQRRVVLSDVSQEQQDYWVRMMADCSFGKGQYGAVTMFADEVPWDVYVYFTRMPRFSDIDHHTQVLHELMHATITILRRKGVELCRESEEAYTYLTEYLVRDFWVKLNQLSTASAARRQARPVVLLGAGGTMGA